MSIGATIKKLRQKQDITQEQLAEFLGISSKAISQWECNKTYPDISQLPLLANIFHVTTDEILGVNIEQKDNLIEAICEKARKLSFEGLKEQEIITLRKGLLEYPNSYRLMATLADSLYCKVCVDIHLSDKVQKNMLEEALSLALKVVNECVEIDIKTDALAIACFTYAHLGEQKNAIELAMKMPIINRGYLLSLLYQNENFTQYFPQYICNELFGPLNIIMNGATWCTDENKQSIYTPQEQLMILQKVISIYKILFENGDFFEVAQWLQIAYFKMADIHAITKDADKMLECLERGIAFGIQFDDYDPQKPHTSLLFRGVLSGEWMKDTPTQTNKEKMLSWLKESHYDFVRQSEKFVKLTNTLQSDILTI